MDIKRQERAPIYEALEEFKKKRVVPFDVPGHKRGRGNPELVHLLGEKCVGLDVNSMKPLDNLCHRERVCQDDFCKFSKFKYLSAEKSPNISCLHSS